MEDLAWIQTATGRQFKVLEPAEDAITPLDIAHALAHTCRFNGHAQSFYSVAQHCCIMVAMLRREGVDDVDVLRWALLHDADEAYLPDVPRPVKPFLFVQVATSEQTQTIDGIATKMMPWATFAGRITFAVAKRFRLFPLSGDPPEEIKRADLRMLATEKRDLFGTEPAEWVALRGVAPFGEEITPLRPEAAREQFLNCLRQLFPRENVPFTATQVGERARSSGRVGSGKRKGM